MYPKIIYKDKINEPDKYYVVKSELEEITACRKLGIEFKKEEEIVQVTETVKRKRKVK